MAPTVGRYQGDTFDRGRPARAPRARAQVVVTIVHHPELARVGEDLIVPEAGEVRLSRLEGLFLPPEGGEARALDDPFVSRRAVILQRTLEGLELRSADGAPASVGDTTLGPEPETLDDTRLERGVLLELGGRVLLGLELRAHAPQRRVAHGVVGRSTAAEALVASIERAATSEARAPILIVGPTGTGKELVARALHALGPRAHAPRVAVNVAAIPPSTAAAALFGHVAGAYTGASRASPGYFGQAHGGVLFLDEIGELASEIQPMLLRALESGEVQPVGATTPRPVDVQVIAATDADLPARVAAGTFRAPLYHRLAARTVVVPPLAARGFDAALLLAHALVHEGAPEALTDGTLTAEPALTPTLVRAVLDAPWPGNVRELWAYARGLIEQARAQQALALPGARAAATAPPRHGPSTPATPSMPATPVGPSAPAALAARETSSTPSGAAALDDGALIAALRAHHFRLADTARALGVSRTHLDQRIAACPGVRKAKDLGAAELQRALSDAGEDLARAAALLEVSERGLRLRLTQLSLWPRPTIEPTPEP